MEDGMGGSSGMRPPSVERLLAAVRSRVPDGTDPVALADAARDLIAEDRARLEAGEAERGLGRADDSGGALPVEILADRLLDRLESWAGSPGARTAPPVSLEPPPPPDVLNATGVILHTNLGRAAWPAVAVEAARRAAAGQVLLELDPVTGRRGARYRLAEDHLVALTGAADALVTNNNAAALALAVGLAGRGGGVVVSRGELVEIGGGVRIPEIIRRSGARLIEVGTTNRTRVADIAEGLAQPRARLVLRVHPSNFVQTGFVESPEPAAVAAAAHAAGAIVVDDLGSGALIETERFGLTHEPTPRERLAAGADLVTFSGDKLVGGPQAGLIAGRADLVGRLRRDPLARAARPDKATLAAVAATLGLYRAGLAVREVPTWRMIAAPAAVIRERAELLLERLSGVGARATTSAAPELAVVSLRATLGGGSLPAEDLASWGLAIVGPSPDRLLGRLRHGAPAVIGRIEGGRVVLDLRTVEPAQDGLLAEAVAAAIDPTERDPGR
jgi:L-seryl-tRNA(Ser) seleniumtransferase